MKIIFIAFDLDRRALECVLRTRQHFYEVYVLKRREHEIEVPKSHTKESVFRFCVIVGSRCYVGLDVYIERLAVKVEIYGTQSRW
jgi:hypothetical protein